MGKQGERALGSPLTFKLYGGAGEGEALRFLSSFVRVTATIY